MGTFRLFNHPVKKIYVYLIAAEALALMAASYAGIYLRFIEFPDSVPELVGDVWPRALMITVVVMLSFVATGLYNRRLRDGFEGIIARLFISYGMALLALLFLFYLFPQTFLGRGVLAFTFFIAFFLTLLTRLVFMKVRRKNAMRQRVLVLGAGERALPLAMLRRTSDLIGFNVVGYVLTEGDKKAIDDDKLIALEEPLPEFVVREHVDIIVVAVDERRKQLPMQELILCRVKGVTVVDLLTFLENETGKIKLDIMYPSWLAFSQGFEGGPVRKVIKRGFDLLISSVLFLAVSPLMLLTAFAVWVESGFSGPILYRQTRVGQGGENFDVLKFRSMSVDAEKDGKAQWATANDNRVTRIGKFIRKYRVDELPQLWNIVRGDMSFVGPRPERPEFVNNLTETLPYYGERHQVKPGLTGWAQICYPYGASERDAFEKLQYDLYYVKNHSLFLDVTILLQTAEVVLWGKGAR